MFEFLVFVAAVATLLATIVYVRSMFRGGTKPNRVSWLIWFIAPFIAAGAAASNGIGWAALPVFVSGLSPFVIFTASFFNKRAFWKLLKFDYVCGILSGLALVLWYLSKNPDVAIMFAILADGLAAIPTLTKAWRYPNTESPWPYIVGIFNASTSFGAAAVWSFSAIAFPTYLIIINIMLLLSIYGERLVLLLRGKR